MFDYDLNDNDQNFLPGISQNVLVKCQYVPLDRSTIFFSSKFDKSV